MFKVALGLITALLLAACTNVITPASKVADGGIGHPDSTYPGPRAY